MRRSARPLAPIVCTCGEAVAVSIVFNLATDCYDTKATCAKCDVNVAIESFDYPSEMIIGQHMRRAVNLASAAPAASS
jgi:hypothetical protein